MIARRFVAQLSSLHSGMATSLLTHLICTCQKWDRNTVQTKQYYRILCKYQGTVGSFIIQVAYPDADGILIPGVNEVTDVQRGSLGTGVPCWPLLALCLLSNTQSPPRLPQGLLFFRQLRRLPVRSYDKRWGRSWQIEDLPAGGSNLRLTDLSERKK